GLNEPARILEGIDIADLQGGETVGSKVTFIDGVSFKDAYRRYKIRHELGNNDYVSIQEVVSRRYREAGANNELYPDVILIDGGLGQLHAAMEVFKTMDVKPRRVLSLAKKEEPVCALACPYRSELMRRLAPGIIIVVLLSAVASAQPAGPPGGGFRPPPRPFGPHGPKPDDMDQTPRDEVGHFVDRSAPLHKQIDT